MTALSRQHFKLAAAIVQDMYRRASGYTIDNDPHGYYCQAVGAENAFVEMFKRSSPNFKEERFRDACQIE